MFWRRLTLWVLIGGHVAMLGVLVMGYGNVGDRALWVAAVLLVTLAMLLSRPAKRWVETGDD